jgi:hypothetical protein
MKKTVFLVCCMMALCPLLLPVRGADAQPTAFEKALYDKARYQVLSRLTDVDFASYCVTMNVGGETLLKFHDEILAKQTELADLNNQGLTSDNPQVMAVNAALKDLRTQYTVKISEARKGMEIESTIAEATLTALSQTQR